MNNSQKIIVLLGAPGSGKGTQAKRLSDVLGITHISTGDLLREHIKKGTELGKKIKSYIDAGKLAPDELILDMLFERLQAEDCIEGYLLDGFPRRLSQAEELHKRLGSSVHPIVIELKVSDEEIIKRISNRLTCKQCGHVHHLIVAPPKKNGVCDLCGGELYQRTDDQPEVVKKRLEAYYAETESVVKYYDSKHQLKTVDGSLHPDQVFQSLLSLVK